MAKHPELVKDEIIKQTKVAINYLLENKNNLYVNVPKEFNTEIHFRTHKQAYRASFYPNAGYLNNDKATHKATNFMDTLKFIMFTE